MMCTVLKNKHCIGRNFDYEESYKEEIIIVPKDKYHNTYSVMGICTGAVDDYPLLYDGINEHGLFCGGLAFEGNAKYRRYQDDMGNIPSFDFTFQVLANNKTVKEAREWLEDVNIWCEPFSDEFPNTDLHWFIADVDEAIIVEQTVDGLNVYSAETNVMTNNPPYPLQLETYEYEKIWVGFREKITDEYSTRGLETTNLSGEYTSTGRFQRASYLLEQSEKAIKDISHNTINETFHLLSSVEQVYGATPVDDKYEYTIYSAVYNLGTKSLWVKTYDKICPVNFSLSDELERVPL